LVGTNEGEHVWGLGQVRLGWVLARNYLLVKRRGVWLGQLKVEGEK